MADKLSLTITSVWISDCSYQIEIKYILNKSSGDYGKDMYTIRRYQKRNGEYIPKSKFNISSSDQAKKIIAALESWIDEK